MRDAPRHYYGESARGYGAHKIKKLHTRVRYFDCRYCKMPPSAVGKMATDHQSASIIRRELRFLT